jgi:hypothetical protein
VIAKRLRLLDKLLRVRCTAQEGEVGAAVKFSVSRKGVGHGRILYKITVFCACQRQAASLVRAISFKHLPPTQRRRDAEETQRKAKSK